MVAMFCRDAEKANINIMAPYCVATIAIMGDVYVILYLFDLSNNLLHA